MIRSFAAGLAIFTVGLTGYGSNNPTVAKIEKSVKEEAKVVADEAKDLGHKAVEGAKDAGHKAVEGAKAAGEKTKEVVSEKWAEAKELYLKTVHETLPKYEEKLKGLSGDAAVKAKEKLEAFKKAVADLKDAAPEKYEELKEKAQKAQDALKQQLGQ